MSDDTLSDTTISGREPSPEETLLNHRFPVLDTLRGVGAIAVLTTHAAFWAGSYGTAGLAGVIAARLDVGVAIFFVLSGFLLARPYLARAASGQPAPGTGRYLWKRALRIVPVYLIAVLISLSFIEENRRLGLTDWFVTLLMGNTFVRGDLPAGLTQMWSLAAEVTFYLVLPALMLLALGRRNRLSRPRVITLLLLMTVLTVVWRLVGTGLMRWSGGEPEQWLPSYGSWFAAGIFLALVQVEHSRGTWRRVTDPIVRLGQQPGSCWALAGGLLLVASTPIVGATMLAPTTAVEGVVKTLVYTAIGALLVLSGVFARPDALFTRVFSTRGPRHLGFISYGIFCLHLPMLHFVMWVSGWTLFEGRFFSIWSLALVLSVALAELSYRFVEMPVMRLKNVRRPGAAASTAAATGTNIT